jgi:hypothetical protein
MRNILALLVTSAFCYIWQLQQLFGSNFIAGFR